MRSCNEPKPASASLRPRSKSLSRTPSPTAAMDWNRIEGNWKQLKGKVKEKWGDLTDDDLDKIAGRRDQFEGLIQQRYGLTKDQARKQVEDWFDEHKAV
jgi:uncharacterized protein YjbJ (UPF0337 family)